ncbi:MAG: MATE family efflux transporter [Oscillospiraceae bacterium]|nr:MATE family efflux transporter [Oscillospiraceae bacterium]
MLKRYVGDRAFYSRIFAVALPIIIQNAITNFVALLDNIMVGQLATAQISGVTIVNNNLMFIFNICMFGAAAGAGIFTTQFRGSGDDEGIRYTFRFKILLCGILSLIAGFAFYFWSDPLIGLYLKGDGDAQLAAETLTAGREYMYVMLWGMLPFAITNAYAGTLRECGKPTMPMVAGIIATFVNLVGNYILIFGHFGAPAMGVRGAALATVISRYVEMVIVIAWTHAHTQQNPYAKGLYRSAHIPGKLLGSIMVKGTPLLINEFFWTVGMAFVNQCYSTCGLDVVPAMSISTTIYNLAAVVFRSLGNTVGIFMGQMLGARRPTEELMDTNRKMTAMAAFSGVFFGAVVLSLSGVFPRLYNTTAEVQTLAARTIMVAAVLMPLQAYSFPVYFTLRAGGKTVMTTLFDCGSIWFLYLPISFLLSRFTNLPFLAIFAICNSTDLIKCIVGSALIRSGNWIQHLAAPEKE